MKKAVFLLVIVIFVVSAVLGFQAAAKLNSGHNSQTQEIQDLPALSTQKNYLLVHVSDLESSEPQLISAWGLFVFYSQPPQVMIIPFYPTYDETRSASLDTAFKIDRDGSLSTRFVQELEDSYQVTMSGLVLVDNYGLSLFNQWLTGEDSQVSAVTPLTSDEKHIVLYNGQQFFRTACDQFTRSGVKSFLDQIRWSNLLPTHFSTNLSFESLALAADHFLSAGDIDQCNVLSDE